jgi:hypothetical protein
VHKTVLGLAASAVLLAASALAQYARVPFTGPEWLVGPPDELVAIWSRTRSLDSRARMLLSPAICGRLRWQEWGGRSCAHGIALMIGDLSARASLCGKSDDHTPALAKLVGSAAYSLPARSGADVAAVLDAYPAQLNKVKAFLLSSPTLRLDCSAVAAQTERIARFLITFGPESMRRPADELPIDGGDGGPSLWDRQTATLYRQEVPSHALVARKEMADRVLGAAAAHLSAALDGASRTPAYDRQKLQVQLDYLTMEEALTRLPRRISLEPVPGDDRVAAVVGKFWDELLVPTRDVHQGGMDVIVQMVWQGGGDPCHVHVYTRGPRSASGAIPCEDFLTELGRGPFEAMLAGR